MNTDDTERATIAPNPIDRYRDQVTIAASAASMTRRTYQKEITIRTEQWSASNGGRTPRGYGCWGFGPTDLERADNGSQAARDTLLAATIWTKGTYAQARHAATQIAATKGITDLTVLP